MNPRLRTWLCTSLLFATSIAFLSADTPGPNETRTFTDNRGRTLVASIVSIDVVNVVLKREPDNKVFTLPIASLSAEDQLFLAENRVKLGKATAPVAPLAPRKVTGTEVAKAKRFAVDVFMREKSGAQRVFRWEKRPALTLLPASGPIPEFSKATFDTFCDAAGLIGPPADGPEIVICTGTKTEIHKLQEKHAPDSNPAETFRWNYRWDGKKYTYKAHIFVVTDNAADEEIRLRVFRCVSAIMGCPGRSDEFPGSAFHNQAKAPALEEIDRQLVRLLYQHLPNNATRDAVLGAVEKHWVSMVAPEGGSVKK